MVFDESRTLSWPILICSLIVCSVLYVTPLPLLGPLRIDGMALLVIYIGLFRPVAWPLTLGFFAGLLQDTVALAPLGQHALGLMLISFLVPWIRDSVRMLSPMMQWPVVLGMLVFMKFLSSWVTALSLGILPSFEAYGSALLTSCFWPALALHAARSPRVKRSPV